MLQYLREAWLVLTLAIVFGVALAGVNSWLAPVIASNESRARSVAALELVPGAASASLEQVQGTEAYRVMDGSGRTVGWVLLGEAKGYADTVKVMFGLSADARQITGMKVLPNNETPGLGNKIQDKPFRQQFAGRPAEPMIAAKKAAAPNEIQAVTGATISSKAVTEALSSQLQPATLAALANATGVSAAVIRGEILPPDAVTWATKPATSAAATAPAEEE